MENSSDRRIRQIRQILAEATPRCATCPGRKVLRFPSAPPRRSRADPRHGPIAAALVLVSAALLAPSWISPAPELGLASPPRATRVVMPGAFDHTPTKYLAGEPAPPACTASTHEPGQTAWESI